MFETSAKSTPPEKPWVATVRALLKVALVAALIYLGVVYYARWSRPPLERVQAPAKKVPTDYYVYPPKSYVTDADSARRNLVGKPLWVKEGYRWIHEPGDTALGPLERVTPTAIVERGDEVLIQFEKDGEPARLAIASAGRFYVDEIFLVKDPRELYSHWPEEAWEQIESHRVEEGMTEHQVAFSLGAGSVTRTSLGQSLRIVEYTLCESAGLPPARVTFRDGVAEQVESLAP